MRVWSERVSNKECGMIWGVRGGGEALGNRDND